MQLNIKKMDIKTIRTEGEISFFLNLISRLQPFENCNFFLRHFSDEQMSKTSFRFFQPECSHFTWTSQNGGTCLLRKGPAHKSEAIATSDPTSICGIRKLFWNKDNWALQCLFRGSDLKSIQAEGDQCGTSCLKTTNW